MVSSTVHVLQDDLCFLNMEQHGSIICLFSAFMLCAHPSRMSKNTQTFLWLGLFSIHFFNPLDGVLMEIKITTSFYHMHGSILSKVSYHMVYMKRKIIKMSPTCIITFCFWLDESYSYEKKIVYCLSYHVINITTAIIND